MWYHSWGQVRKAYRSKVNIHSRPYVGVRHPARSCSTTRAAASAKLGMPWVWRFSASGSPPLRASGWPAPFPSFGKRDRCETAESEFAPPAAYREDRLPK